MCPTCTPHRSAVSRVHTPPLAPWNLVPLTLNQPVSIGILCTASHRVVHPVHSHVYAHAPFIRFGGRCRPTQSLPTIFCRSSRVSPRSLSSADPPSIQHAYSLSVFGHIAVSLSFSWFPLPLSICLVSSVLLSHAATYTSLYLQSVHSNNHRSALQKAPCLHCGAHITISLETPPLPPPPLLFLLRSLCSLSLPRGWGKSEVNTDVYYCSYCIFTVLRREKSEREESFVGTHLCTSDMAAIIEGINQSFVCSINKL